MILVEKDRHMRGEEPFFMAQIDYNNWFVEQDFDNPSTDFISLGDWFHTAHPTPEEVSESIRFFKSSKINKFYILAGNHDWSGILKQYSILPFQNLPNVEIICKPCVKTIQGKTFAFLPHYKNLKYMRENYTKLGEDFINADFVCYHFEDETQHKGINISYLKGKRLGGHVHTIHKNYELSMPILSRYDERGMTPSIYSLLDEKTIKTLRLIDYIDLDYGEEADSRGIKYPILTVKNAPSRELAREKYKCFHIRDIRVVNKKKEKIEAFEDRKLSIMDFFHNYINERDDLEDWSTQKLKQVVGGR